jgi:fructokinase
MTANLSIAGLELGGTKCVATLGSGPADVREQHVVPTTDPATTLAGLEAVLDGWAFDAIGIASFGPIELNPARPDFGSIVATTKPGWNDSDVFRRLSARYGKPLAIQTDVNGAALAEYRWGAGQGCTSLCYVTIGTGLGGGLLIGGQPVHGAMHPEIGHLRLRRVEGDSFDGACPFHGDCVEGLVSGPALAKRLDMDPATAPDHHPGWRHAAADIAELCGTILLTSSAQRILFGGSVATLRPFLLPWVRTQVVAQLGSYLPFLSPDSVESIILPAGLGTDAGPLGAIALAQAAAAASAA